MKKTTWIASHIKDLLTSFPAKNSRMKKRCFAALCAAVCALALVTGCSSETDEPEGIVYDAGKWLIDGSTVMRYTGTETDVQVPDGVTVIGKHAFEARTAVASVTLPDSVVIIEDYAFSGCTSLADVKMPASTAIIGWHAFRGCKSLADVTIPAGVESIGAYAFYDCDGLTSVTIPGSVTSIGYWAFYDCDSLTTVTIPASVKNIGDDAFYACTSLASVTYQGSLAQWCALDNDSSLTRYAKTVTVEGKNLKDLTELVIPDGVETIGDYAFYDCDGLTSVTIPAGVENIGDYAFLDCDGLTSVTIPGSVTSIGDSAFLDCDSLTTVTISAGVESIGDRAFEYCSKLTDVTYDGTQGDWNKIKKGSSIFYSTKVTEITGKDGVPFTVDSDGNSAATESTNPDA